MTTIIVKSFEFEASHQLPYHDGKCRNLHGHSYKLDVILQGEPVTDVGSPQEGMVVDFGEVSAVVKPRIIEKLDHRFIAKGDEQIFIPEEQIITIGVRSTAENIGKWILNELRETALAEKLVGVRVWETASGRAEVYVERER